MKTSTLQKGVVGIDELEHQHVASLEPFVPFGGVGEIRRYDRYSRLQPAILKHLHRTQRVGRIEIDHQFEILGEARASMQIDGNATDDQVTNAGRLQRVDDSKVAASKHGLHTTPALAKLDTLIRSSAPASTSA